MDAWEWTKITASIGAAVTVALAGSWIGDRAVEPRYPRQPVFAPEGVADSVDLAGLQRSWPSGLDAPGEHSRLIGYLGSLDKRVAPAAAADARTGPAEPPPDLGTLLAAADVAKGAGTARACAACHTFDQGGADRVGPNLWAVVGRDIAGKGGFAYSPAIAAQPGAWTYEQLDRYLASPARAIPGNRMAFGGIRRDQDRANVLAYLGSLGAQAVPFPAPVASAGGGAGDGGR